MTDRELMQQALDALESECDATKFGAAEDLRARLAGWERVNMYDHKEGDLGIGTVKWDASAPLVVHPHPAFQTTEPQREWIGLTDEEIQQIQISASSKLSAIYITEAQLKGKNA